MCILPHTHPPKDISMIPCLSLQAFISPPTLNWAPFQKGRSVLQFHNTKSFEVQHSHLPLNPYYGLLLILLTLVSIHLHKSRMFLPDGSAVKYPPGVQENKGSIPESGRSPGKRNGNPLQYSCLENPMDRGSWWATAHELSDWNHDNANHWINNPEQSSSRELPLSVITNNFNCCFKSKRRVGRYYF